MNSTHIQSEKERQVSHNTAIDAQRQVNQQYLLCPTCHCPTPSLKRYHFVKWCLFLGIATSFQRETHTACPACMRQYLWKRSLLIAVPANFVWLFGLLPLTIILTIATFSKGHSKNIVL
ncbi:MAG: hypothetical protein U0401_05695 [Anaerolineae bacterium]